MESQAARTNPTESESPTKNPLRAHLEVSAAEENAEQTKSKCTWVPCTRVRVLGKKLGCKYLRALWGRESLTIFLLMNLIGASQMYIYGRYGRNGGLEREYLWVILTIAITAFSLALRILVKTLLGAYPKATRERERKEWMKVFSIFIAAVHFIFVILLFRRTGAGGLIITIVPSIALLLYISSRLECCRCTRNRRQFRGNVCAKTNVCKAPKFGMGDDEFALSIIKVLAHLISICLLMVENIIGVYWITFPAFVVAISLPVMWCFAHVYLACKRRRKKNIERNEEGGTKMGTCNLLKTAKRVYSSIFDIKGKFYISKMFFAEAFEHIQQIYSINVLYMCIMPVEISAIFCLVLCVEIAINICATFHMESQEVRDRLLLLDVFTDMFCIAFPLLYVHLGYDAPIELEKLILIEAYPAVSILLKLNDIWEDYYSLDIQRIQDTTEGERQSTTRGQSFHRRSSILKLSKNKLAFEAQLKHFPTWLRNSFVVLNVVFLLFFVSVLCVQFVTRPSDEYCADTIGEQTWKGCQIQVPFCQNTFVPNCDCSVLQMVNYTQESLPDSFGKLKSLTLLGIYHGELKMLPESFGKDHKKLIVLRIVGNKLKALPESIGKLETLVEFVCIHTQLMHLPEFLNAKKIIRFWAFNNQLTSLPEGMGEMKLMQDLRIHNNRIGHIPFDLGNFKLLTLFHAWNNTKYVSGLAKPENQIMDSFAVVISETDDCPDCPWELVVFEGTCDDNDYTYHFTKTFDPNARPKSNSGCYTQNCSYDVSPFLSSAPCGNFLGEYEKYRGGRYLG